MISKIEKERIKTASKYNLELGTLKCELFMLLDQGYSLKEARYLLRKHPGKQNAQTFRNTTKRYLSLWQEAQRLK